MKNFLVKVALLALVCFLNEACTGERPQNAAVAADPIAIETIKIERRSGADCDKPDGEQVSCAIVSFHYPVVKSGGDALKSAVETWAKDFMVGMVAYAAEPDNMPPLDVAIQGFFDMHREMAAEMPDIPALYSAETRDTVLLNDGKYLTLKLDGYSYAGGAHPNPTSAVATWDVASGKLMRPEDFITDLAALQERAEKKFREVKAEVFKPESEGGWGYEFDEVFPFKIADNTGLLEDGLYFCYVPYEVGPYVMGYTEFVLTFDELKDLMK